MNLASYYTQDPAGSLLPSPFFGKPKTNRYIITLDGFKLEFSSFQRGREIGKNAGCRKKRGIFYDDVMWIQF